MTKKIRYFYHITAPYRKAIVPLLFFLLLGSSLVSANISLGSSVVASYHNDSKIPYMLKRIMNSSSFSPSPSLPNPTSQHLMALNNDLNVKEKDKFGIDMLYPTKKGGQEWFINMGNPTLGGRFNPQDKITKNADGSWKMMSDKVRMYVYTSNGYNPNQITSYSGQSKVATRGFMGSPQDWRDVEITGYVKLNSFTQNDNFVWYSRGGRHSDSDHCQGSAYKGNLFYLGETQFSKEQWHVSFAKSPTIVATDPVKGKWIGFKFVMYNFADANGKTAVKLENWIDKDADGTNWLKVYEGADAGKWGRSGSDCKVNPDQIISWGGPIASYRWDFAPNVDFKDLSVREINETSGVTQGVTYFTGTSSSSHVQNFGSSNTPSGLKSSLVDQNNTLPLSLGGPGTSGGRHSGNYNKDLNDVAM